MSTILPPGSGRLSVMGAGRRRGKVYEQTQGADIDLVMIDQITIPETRERKPTPATIAKLKAGIATDGLLHPIGIKITDDAFPKKYRVVYGASRLMAWIELHGDAVRIMQALATDASREDVTDAQREVGNWEQIPAVVYPKSMSDKMCRRFELAENLHRGDLSRDERTHLETEYGKMLVVDRETVPTEPKRPSVPTEPKPKPKGGAAQSSEGGLLFSDWYKGANVSKTRAHGEWNDFRSACGVENSSDKCTVGEFERFLDWRTKRDEDAKAADEAKKNEQQAQAAAKAKQKRRDALLAAWANVMENDGEAEAFQIIREANPDLTINVLQK